MFGFWRRRRQLSPDEVISLLATFATKNTLSESIRARLPAEVRGGMGQADEMEWLALDLWIVTEALVRTRGQLSDASMELLVNGFHLKVYTALLSGGMSDQELTAFQRGLRQRYTAYGQCVSELAQGSTQAPFLMSRAVTRNVFGRESTDPVIAVTIGGCVMSSMLAIAEVLKEALPRVSFA
jgi:hypothetical protein